jgi:hypothetical protein
VTEIAIHEDNGSEVEVPAQQSAPALPQDVEVSPLVLWAFEAKQASQIAASLARTSFVPASLRSRRSNPEEARQEEANNITAAILAGMELGLKPMATMRSIDIVQGTPTLRAHAMRGLVQSAGHDIELLESSPTLCRMRGRRAGSEAWQEVLWTIQRATALGITGRDQWKKQPQTMLVARATGEICRLIASDVLYAMPYASEELHDSADLPDGGRTTVAPRVTREEILRRPEPEAPALPPAPVAEPETTQPEEADTEWPLPPGHEGPHDSWGYNPQCPECEAHAEADRQAAQS